MTTDATHPEATLGALVRELRETANISLEELAEATRIQKKYLVALEEDAHKELPDPTYVRHFLRAVATALNVSPETLFARYQPPGEPAPGRMEPPAPTSALAFLVPSRILARAAIAGFVVVVLAVLFWQVRALFTPPELLVTAPADAALLNEPVATVVGRVRGRGAEVRINNELVYPDEQGDFRIEIDLQQGANLIKIAAKKPRSAERVLWRQVVVETAAPATSTPPARP
ncbi:hypothetical protein EPO33_04185 [Patescibacteria group bacterium]|nr:MAG: hypothetical protein EPO33_04185 [Patescibacteria group bacterium]